MLQFLEHIYSWPCAFGAIGGLAIQRLYRHMEAGYGNRHHPLPDGRKYRAAGINPVWIAGLVAALTVGYVLMSAERARVDSQTTALRVTACVLHIQDALSKRSDITGQDSELSNQVSDLRDQLDDAMATLMGRILNPPSDIAHLDPDDPRRVAWKQDAEYAYTDWAGKLRGRIATLTDKRAQLALDRAAHPIPPLDC